MPGRAAPCAGPGNTPGALRPRAGDRRTGRAARHRSAGAARPDRPEPGAARGAAPRRRADRLETPARARRRSRAGEARPRRGAVAVGRQCADQCRLRGARDARRLGGGAVERAGYRHRHRHGAGAGRGRGARTSPRRRSPCASATPSFPPGRPPMAAARPPRSRRRPAPPRGACCRCCFARPRSALECGRRAI